LSGWGLQHTLLPGCHTSFTRGSGCGSKFVIVLNIALVENLVVNGYPTSQTASRKICSSKIRACVISAYLNRPYVSVRGMYPHSGHFYRPYVPYPELNLVVFFEWLELK